VTARSLPLLRFVHPIPLSSLPSVCLIFYIADNLTPHRSVLLHLISPFTEASMIYFSEYYDNLCSENGVMPIMFAFEEGCLGTYIHNALGPAFVD
jgi:hypothetical protein